MPKYRTRQRAALLEFLRAHPDEALSAAEIAAEFPDASISVSAVYRNLAALEAEGKLRRFSRPGSREARYQFLDTARCRNCLHLSCTACGRTFHMHALGAARLEQELAQNDEFRIDRGESVLYGLCRDCQKREGDAAR